MGVELTLKKIHSKSAKWDINMDKVLKVALTCLSVGSKENSKPQTRIHRRSIKGEAVLL